ncbi:hypothetical protein A2U01_0075030, partial [Trifolium medium]|nr:hypothetical protein [Trifolium medium]
FPANLLEDSEGNPILDDNGQQKTSAKLVTPRGCWVAKPLRRWHRFGVI